MIGYVLHPEAFTDIDEIWEYIAEDNIDAADRVVSEIFAAVATLVRSPHIGHRRPDLTTSPLRFHLVRDYLIAYAPNETPLWILAVLHGRRNPRVMAAILRARDEEAG
jgi:plasmid stabilization system protein ParE